LPRPSLFDIPATVVTDLAAAAEQLRELCARHKDLDSLTMDTLDPALLELFCAQLNATIADWKVSFEMQVLRKSVVDKALKYDLVDQVY
jgi:hypothetical protein